MINNLRVTGALLLGMMMLTACQTPTQKPKLDNQTSQTINMPTVSVNLDSDGDGVPDALDGCPNTSENVVVDERGCHLIMGPDMSLKMEYRAFFAKGSSELAPKYQIELDKIAVKMKEYDTATFRIEAHASEDEIEKESTLIRQTNSLPKNRALMVKNYLVLKHSIEPSRLSTFNCGARGPIAPSDTEEGKSMNRRVYGVVTKPEEQAISLYQNDSYLDRCIEL